MSEESEMYNGVEDETIKKKNFISRFWKNLKDKYDWKRTIRPRALEVLTLLSFLGGVTLTALIASGVLLWGPIGLGICATLGFIGASHLFGTASWLSYYYCDDDGNPWFRDAEDSKNSEYAGDGWIRFAIIIKFIVLPIIFALGGISLVVLGSLGIMGLGLGLGLGIPSIVAALFAFNYLFGDHYKEGLMRGVWLACMAVAGMIAAATFFILGLAGILAWSSVLAFGVPAVIAAIVTSIIGIAIDSTNWICFRTKVEELLEPVLFLGGIALTVLISLGILPFGAVGIGICSMLTFFSASRFLTTNSWSDDHNYHYSKDVGSLIDDKEYKETRVTKLIFSLVGIIAGIALLALGTVGVFGFGLGFAVGMPILAPSICGVVKECLHRYDDYMSQKAKAKKNDYKTKFNVSKSDNVQSVSTAISGAIVAGVSLGLGFGGVLALPVAIAVAAPLAAFSALIGLVHLFLFGLSKTDPESLTSLKNRLKVEDDEEDDKNKFKLSLFGIGFYKCEIDNERKLDDSFDSL